MAQYKLVYPPEADGRLDEFVDHEKGTSAIDTAIALVLAGLVESVEVDQIQRPSNETIALITIAKKDTFGGPVRVSVQYRNAESSVLWSQVLHEMEHRLSLRILDAIIQHLREATDLHLEASEFGPGCVGIPFTSMGSYLAVKLLVNSRRFPERSFQIDPDNDDSHIRVLVMSLEDR